MNISAINCTPIKPQASFKGDAKISKQELEQIREMMNKTDKIDSEYVHADSVKGPLAVVGSVALATIAAFAFGSKIISYARKAIPDLANPDSAKYFENYIRKGAEKVKSFATNLQEGNGKLPKVKKFIGQGIAKAEDLAKTAYKKIVNIGTKNLQNSTDIAAKKLDNLGGAVAVATMVPGTMKADNNGDGVSDLCQTDVSAYTGSVNPYDGTKSKIQGATNIIGDIIDAVT